jgi:hypothetical protein
MIARRSFLATLVAAAWIAAVAPAFPVDGVIEINQTRALAGGVTPGDAAGFPVTISQPGSYRLTGNLDVPGNRDGVQIEANDVTLDLNGFTMFSSGEVGSNDGIIVPLNEALNVEIRNGTVKRFFRHGIFALSSSQVRVIKVRAVDNLADGMRLEGESTLVDQCAAIDNGIFGINAAGDGSLVINSVMRGNSERGLAMGFRGGYRSNAISNNNGGDANPQVFGTGKELGANVCGFDTICP